MDIGYRKYVVLYVDFLDNFSNVIDVALYDCMDQSVDSLIDSVISYVHDNFPSILISGDFLSDRVRNIYVQKTQLFKKDMDFRKASVKYDLNGSFSLPKIREYMEKGNKDFSILFKSISYGTNASYKDTVVNISGDIFGTIQRSSNNNLVFAKRTKETQDYINNLVLNSYREFMSLFGNKLLDKGLNPLKALYDNVCNYVEASNKDIIDDYNRSKIAV